MKSQNYLEALQTFLNKPNEKQYTLYIELNEIVNVTETEEKNVWIDVNWGLQTIFTPHTVKYNKKTKSYKFTNKKHKLGPIKASYPVDYDQVPDIVVTLKTLRYMGGDWDVGYFRLKPKNYINNSDPEWIKFKSLEKPHTFSGKMLCTFCVATSNEFKYKPKKKGNKNKFQLMGKLFYSLDILPDQKEDQIKTIIKCNVAGKENQTEKPGEGHDPVWDHDIYMDLELPKDLKYAPDLTLTLVRQYRFYRDDNIGEINISLDSLQAWPDRPKFYKFYNTGKCVSKLLAMLYICESRTENTREDNELMKEICSFHQVPFYGNIKVLLLGVRNLKNLTGEQAKIETKLIGYAKKYRGKYANEDSKEENDSENEEEHKSLKKQDDIESHYDDQEDEEKKYEGIKHTRNPKLLYIESFKNVNFYENALLWPILSIKISDASSYFGQGQSLEIKLPLIKYVDFLTLKEKNEYTRILEKAYKYKTSILDNSIDSVENISEETKSEDLDDLENESEDEEENKNDNDAEGESQEADSEESEQESENDYRNYEDSDINSHFNEGEDEEKDEDNEHYQTYRHNLKEMKLNTLESKYKPKNSPLMNLCQRDYVDMNDVITLKVHKEDKEFEAFQRNREIKKLKRIRDFYTEKMVKARRDEQKKRKREKIIRTKFAIEKLEEEIMPEDKFWGFAGENDNEFEYGRPVLNDQIYEATLKIPYLKFEINANPEMTFQELKSLDSRQKGINNEDPHI